MFFDVVKSHWKESFDFFKWQNLRLMMLASLNNFRRALVIFAKELWGFVFLLFCFQVLDINVLLFHIRDQLGIINFLAVNCLKIATVVGFFFFLLSVRPSVELKDRSYFLKYLPRVWGAALLALVTPAYALPFLVVSVLFFIDLRDNAPSLLLAVKNSFKFCFHFFPSILGLTLFSLIPFYIFSVNIKERIATTLVHMPAAIYLVLPTVTFLFGVMFKALLISLCVMYYIKVKHAHHRLFFNN
ncbi:hypothetical protein K2W90_00380 [Candidatus Babeliales bacterium]|nr:hypothetical protein [Candidatus Babeliales bacterium]